jgi:large subunit ribosomal protein L10
MPTAKKVEAVAELTDLLSRSTVVIGADYRGLSVAEVTALRRQLRDNGVEMHVIKNTLFLRAAEAAGKAEMAPLAEGPTALVIGFSDPLGPVKTVIEYQRTARNAFTARSAYLDGEIVPANRLSDLASLPGKEQLIAQVAGALQSPITSFAYLIQATLQEFAGLLDARAGQLEGAAA